MQNVNALNSAFAYFMEILSRETRQYFVHKVLWNIGYWGQLFSAVFLKPGFSTE